MANDPVLGLFGLAKRAGKLGLGDDISRELAQTGKARCVFVASDAGAGTEKRAQLYAQHGGVPCVQLPFDRAALGGALGRSECAICVLTEIGMAASAVGRLAQRDPSLAPVAEVLKQKEQRIRARRGTNKKTAAAAKPHSGADKPDSQLKTEVSANGNRK